MPCTKFMPVFNSEGLLECQPNIVNSSKEMGKGQRKILKKLGLGFAT